MPSGKKVMSLTEINSAQLLCIVLYSKIEMAYYLSWFCFVMRILIVK